MRALSLWLLVPAAILAVTAAPAQPLPGMFSLAQSGPAPASAPAGLADEPMLRAAGIAPDAAGLTAFFRARAAASVDPDLLRGQVTRLGQGLPAQREAAVGEVVGAGPAAVPLLRELARDSDRPEAALAARRALQFLEGPQASALPAAAARALARLRPPQAAAALLDYAPFADDESVVEEVKAALFALAAETDAPASALMTALDSPSPLRRTLAAETLCRVPGPVPPSVRRLLQDPRPEVRLRVALALAGRKEADAVPALIDLLAVLPLPLGRQAEEYLLQLAADTAPKPALTDEASRAAARDGWAAWWRGTQGDGPLLEFRKRTLSDADRTRVQELVRQLGADEFAARERAQAALQEMGAAAVPLLRQAAAGDDEEVKKRAQRCLEVIDKDKASPQLHALARLVGLRKPPGAAAVLLGYLPLAEEESLLDELRSALAATAVRDGQPDPALVTALADPAPLRRGAAAEALLAAGAPAETQAAVRRLLGDPEPAVRLRAALALAGVRDRDAVPVLIDLLAALPPEKAAEAEAYLRAIAGDGAPAASVTGDPTAGPRARDAWARWWKDNASSVVLGRLPTGPRLLGCTLIVATDFNRVFEIGMDGKTRWQIDGLQYPRDARVLPGDRVLIAEQGIQRVAEWSPRRDILWQKQVAGAPVSCQRLPNGNTFIAMNNGLVEVTRSGQEVFTHNRPASDIMAGSRGPDGQIALVTGNGMLVRLDASGKEIKSFSLGGQAPWHVELLPGGRVLAAQPSANRVAEFDLEGKVLWEAPVVGAFAATRLPNGHTLVASHGQMRVLEINRTGRVVWEHRTNPNERPYLARRR